MEKEWTIACSLLNCKNRGNRQEENVALISEWVSTWFGDVTVGLARRCQTRSYHERTPSTCPSPMGFAANT